MQNIDDGIEGMVINHNPITENNLKRLLLIFDKLHFTPPDDNLFFMEKNAISYEIIKDKNLLSLYTYNGATVAEQFKNAIPPELSEEALKVCEIINFVRDGKQRQIFNMSEIVPLYKGEEYRLNEDAFFDKFSLAIDKKCLNIIDYKTTDFYQKRGINLKEAYDDDVADENIYKNVKDLFIQQPYEMPNLFIPSPPLPTMHGLEIFKGSNYNSKNFKDNLNNKFNYQLQYFSIVAKFNKKLSLCENFNISPIFIDKSMYNLYLYKFNKSKKSKDDNFLAEWKNQHKYPLSQINNLLYRTSFGFLKDNILENLSLKQILEYKDVSFNKLYNIKKSIIDEINNIKYTSVDSSNIKEVNKLIEKKLKQDFVRYSQENNKLFSTVFNISVNTLVGSAIASLGFAQNLNPFLIVGLSGLSPAVVNEIASLANSLKERSNNKYENTFSYYFDLQKYI